MSCDETWEAKKKKPRNNDIKGKCIMACSKKKPVNWGTWVFLAQLKPSIYLQTYKRTLRTDTSFCHTEPSSATVLDLAIDRVEFYHQTDARKSKHRWDQNLIHNWCTAKKVRALMPKLDGRTCGNERLKSPGKNVFTHNYGEIYLPLQPTACTSQTRTLNKQSTN